jgi:hypothetical protein
MLKQWELDDWLVNWRAWAEPWNLQGPRMPIMCASMERLHVFCRGMVMSAEEGESFVRHGDFRDVPLAPEKWIADDRRGEFLNGLVQALPTYQRRVLCHVYLYNRGPEKAARWDGRSTSQAHDDLRAGRFTVAQGVKQWRG